MKKTKCVVVSGLLLSAVSPSLVHGGTVVASTNLGARSILQGHGYGPEAFLFDFGMIADGVFTEPWILLADDVALTAADSGTTWEFSGAAVDAIKVEFADVDFDDLFGWGHDPSGFGFPSVIQNWQEPVFGDAGLPPAQTLAGLFDEIHVTIELYIEPFEGLDAGDPVTTFELQTRWDFVRIPAPGSSAVLCVLGAAALGRRRR